MKKKIALSAVGVFAVLVLAVGVFWYFHPTYYKFNDRFILGNSEDGITEKYGEFDYGKYVVARASFLYASPDIFEKRSPTRHHSQDDGISKGAKSVSDRTSSPIFS